MATEYGDRRSGRERRDWAMFVYPERRSGIERRSGVDRRQINGSTPAYDGPERRRSDPTASSPRPKLNTVTPIPSKEYLTTQEVVDVTGLSQTTLLLWIRNKIIDGSRIKRSVEGKRLWTREDIEEIKRIKAKDGWVE